MPPPPPPPTPPPQSGSPPTRIADLPALAAIAGFGLAVAALTTLVDLLAWPLVRLGRRPADDRLDQPPPSRNASVIVLTFDGLDYLRQLMPTLERAVDAAPGDHEVIVVDNGSRDGSAAWLAEHHPRARVIALPENRHFIRGNAAGVAAASRDVLVFVNNDMRLEPDFLARLLQGFGAGDVFAVTARIEMEGDRVETGCTRGQFRAGALHQLQSAWLPDGPAPVLWAGGGSSAFDRAKLEALGGFEALYEPCYVEDLSLSYQAWRRGWRVLFEPRAIAHHVHQGTSQRVFGAAAVRRLDRRNRELFFWRSITDPRLVWSRGALLWWNALKDRAHLPIGQQLGALLAALPRLPRALLARQASRRVARRSDREVLRVANSVARHRRLIDVRPRRALTVLSVGCEPSAAAPADGLRLVEHTVALRARAAPPAQDVLGLVPRRFWGSADDVAATERLRDLLRETDHDVVLFRDPWALAACPRELVDPESVLLMPTLDEPGGTLERWRERRFLHHLAARVGVVACPREDDAARLRALRPGLRCVVTGAAGDAPALTELCRAAAEGAP